MAKRLDEEIRAKSKLFKRQGRQEESLATEVEQLKDELSKTRLDLEASQVGFRDAIQTRDAHLAAAETQAMSLKGHIDVLESDVKRLNDQIVAREKELVATYDERMLLELKQQQLRYDRRLQVRTYCLDDISLFIRGCIRAARFPSTHRCTYSVGSHHGCTPLKSSKLSPIPR
jgi:chromosome segregation ATPase